jgi:hypothetical protein
MSLLRDTLVDPFKKTKAFVKNPSTENLGGIFLGNSSQLTRAATDATPWKFDDKAGNKFGNFLDDKDTKQATGTIGSLIAAIYGGAALAGAGAAGGAAGGAGAAGTGAAGGGAATGGSYGAGAYGTAAGYGGVTAPAATGGIASAPAGGGLLAGAGGYAKAGLAGLQGASLAKGLLDPGTQAPQMQQPSGAGMQELAALNQANQQAISGISDSSAERRRMNQEIIARMMGGRNYG